MSIAVVVIGIFALPSTVSLFGGQHKWYDLGGKGNEVPCEKCHADTAAEMESQIGPHTGETGYGRMKCVYCHRLFPIEHKNASFDTYAYASGDGTGAEPGKEAHAASTVACMYCHSGEEAGIVAPQDAAMLVQVRVMVRRMFSRLRTVTSAIYTKMKVEASLPSGYHQREVLG